MQSMARWWWMCLWWGCAAVSAQDTVLLGAEDDWAPYSSATPDRRTVEGLAPELVTAAFDTQGVRVTFKVLPFARCMLHAERGLVAGCFNATRVTGNQDLYCWHPTPLFQEELAIFGPHSYQATRELGVADLEGKRVGVTLGYTYPTEFMRNPKVTRVSAASDDNLLQMLAARRVDYILINTLPAYVRLASMPTVKGQVKRVGVVSQDAFWVAFSKKHPDGQRMCQRFEQGLQAIKASGRYDQAVSQLRRRVQPH